MRHALVAALAAASAVAYAPAPATAVVPVQGTCTVVPVPGKSSTPTLAIVATATTAVPALEIGVACWITDGGFGGANANNPGVATAAAGIPELYRSTYSYCYETWARWVGGSYTSAPVCH